MEKHGYKFPTIVVSAAGVCFLNSYKRFESNGFI